MTHAEQAKQSSDPYQYCIAHFEARYIDRAERTIRFVFADESEVTFSVRYVVKLRHPQSVTWPANPLDH